MGGEIRQRSVLCAYGDLAGCGACGAYDELLHFPDDGRNRSFDEKSVQKFICAGVCIHKTKSDKYSDAAFLHGDHEYFPSLHHTDVFHNRSVFPAGIAWFTVCFNSYPIIQKYVINPYYDSIGETNPELADDDEDDSEEVIFEDMGGKEKPIEKRKKGKGKRIS